MRYLVIVDARSPIGAIFAGSTRLTKLEENPVLDCTEIGLDNPHYLRVVRSLESGHATFLIPHRYVLAVRELLGESESRTVGFL
jgi:hypothetical protein